MLGFWFILVAFIVVIWSSLFRTHVQIGSWGLYLPYHLKKLSKLWLENTGFVFSKKSSELLFFLIFFSAGIYFLKVWLKRSQNVYIFFFFHSQGAYNCSSQGSLKLIKTTSSFSKASIPTNKAHLMLIFFQGLHISTCKTYYNLSIKRENYQLD